MAQPSLKGPIKTISNLLVIMTGTTLLFSGLTAVAQTNGPVIEITQQHANIITFSGNSETQYVLQSSSNLVSWQSLGIVMPTSGTNYTVTNITSANTLFYRIAATPVNPISFVLNPTPGDGTNVIAGQSYTLAQYAVHANKSDVSNFSISLDFDVRLWLYADSVTIKDGSGTVVGQVSGLSSANFVEYAVGSDYRLSIPIQPNVVTSGGGTTDLTVIISFPSGRDRTVGSLHIIRAEVKAEDENGVIAAATTTQVRQFNYVP